MQLIYISKNSWWDKRKARKVLLPLAFSKISGQSCLLVNTARPLWRSAMFPRRWQHPETLMAVFTPMRVLPLQRFKLFRWINQYLQCRQILSELRAGRETEDVKVFILSDPEHGMLAHMLQQRGYKCYYDWTERWDEYAAAIGSENQHKINDFNEILEHVNGVIVVSRILEEEAKSKNLPCLFLPNAVSDFFDKDVAGAATLSLPELLQRCPAPRVAHIGTANPGWIEWEHLVSAARENPSVSFCMVGGKSAVPVDSPYQFPANIYFLGNVCYELLPSIMFHCDAFMLLYRPRETAAGDPTKLYEYLMTGKPIVATCHPRCIELQQHLYLANSPLEFARQIKRALAEEDAAARAARQKTAIENTWSIRARTLYDWIQSN